MVLWRPFNIRSALGFSGREAKAHPVFLCWNKKSRTLELSYPHTSHSQLSQLLLGPISGTSAPGSPYKNPGPPYRKPFFSLKIIIHPGSGPTYFWRAGLGPSTMTRVGLGHLVKRSGWAWMLLSLSPWKPLFPYM